MSQSRVAPCLAALCSNVFFNLLAFRQVVTAVRRSYKTTTGPRFDRSARFNRHSGFKFSVGCGPWVSRFTDWELGGGGQKTGSGSGALARRRGDQDAHGCRDAWSTAENNLHTWPACPCTHRLGFAQRSLLNGLSPRRMMADKARDTNALCEFFATQGRRSGDPLQSDARASDPIRL